MNPIGHRFDNLSEEVAMRLERLLVTSFDGFGASWDRLMVRNATRVETEEPARPDLPSEKLAERH